MDDDRWASGGDDLEPLVYMSHDRGMPSDAQRMGLDRNTEEGALIAMAGSLSSANRLHRIVAWGLLAAFCLPLLITFWHEFL